MTTTKQAVLLWCSGCLTTFVLIGLLHTVFQAELAASRRLFERASSTLTRLADTASHIDDTIDQSLSQAQQMATLAKQTHDLYLEAKTNLPEVLKDANQAVYYSRRANEVMEERFLRIDQWIKDELLRDANQAVYYSKRANEVMEDFLVGLVAYKENSQKVMELAGNMNERLVRIEQRIEEMGQRLQAKADAAATTPPAAQ